MKKCIIDYYAIIMLGFFIVYNLILDNLKISGLLYQIFMFILIIINGTILIVFRKKVKYKSLVIIIYFLIWLFSKNMLQCLFNFSNILILCVLGFMESNFIKVISFMVTIFVFVFFYPLLFIFLFTFGLGFDEERGMDDIYDDTHYYCEDNYEVYSYSAGAMDSFHYSIGKYYNILNIEGIISISYNERREKTYEEYEKYLEENECKLVIKEKK